MSKRFRGIFDFDADPMLANSDDKPEFRPALDFSDFSVACVLLCVASALVNDFSM